MASARPVKPLISSRADDPDSEEAIERFVVTLGERVDALQDAESGGDLVALGTGARELVEQARALGYEPLARIAAALGYACGEGDAQAAHKAVVEVTELSKRIRRGHRTSA